MPEDLRFLLLQVRDANDPMREHEVGCFARTLPCRVDQIEVVDLLRGAPSAARLDAADIVLLGGSGNYSVARGGPWLAAALEAMRALHRRGQPTFASCWGFQAMARALGGTVVTDLSRAEVGTHRVYLTDAGRADPVLGPLTESTGDGNVAFLAQMGHQDIVESLPEGAVRLASSDRVENQAFRFEGRPIYCTQFHPELNRADLLMRLHQYPEYVERIMGIPIARFEREHCFETPAPESILPRFVKLVTGR